MLAVLDKFIEKIFILKRMIPADVLYMSAIY